MIRSFQPAPGLRNPHVQALLSQSPVRAKMVREQAGAVLAAARPLLLHGGEAALLGLHSPHPHSRRLAVLVHGFEGSVGSNYMLATAARLYAQGFAVLRLNLRDHGDSLHLNRELFHSCREAEVGAAIEDAVQRLQPSELVLAGFSLGGNFCLRLGTRFPATLPLRSIVAVCPILDPAATLGALETGFWLYQLFFLYKWRASLARKSALFPEVGASFRCDELYTLRAMTAHLVQRHTDFPDLSSYLRAYAVTGDRLADLRFPAHIVVAEDDPLIPAGQIDELAPSSQLSVLRLPYGGHCGFISDWHLHGWIENYIADYLHGSCTTETQAEPAAVA